MCDPKGRTRENEGDVIFEELPVFSRADERQEALHLGSKVPTKQGSKVKSAPRHVSKDTAGYHQEKRSNKK